MVSRLVELLRGQRWVALTGAGCSTDSGIPDYRGLGARGRPRASIQGPEFRRSAAVRRRYWARATLGWELIRGAEPNPGHRALAELEGTGTLSGVITQNVDRLHHGAGSRRVIELHGALAEVRCLACGVIHARDDVQRRLTLANEPWLAARAARATRAASAAPDGDAELEARDVEDFVVVPCTSCEGDLQPNVVFFGDNVARPLVDEAFRMVDEADGLLVAGTSLAVFSGYRFLRRATERGIPIAIVNLGPVRGEEHATVKIEASTAVILPAVAEGLGRGA